MEEEEIVDSSEVPTDSEPSEGAVAVDESSQQQQIETTESTTGTTTEVMSPYLSEDFNGYLYPLNDILLCMIIGLLLIHIVMGGRKL